MRKIAFTLLVAGLACSGGGGPRLPTSARGETVVEVRGAVKGGPFLLGREDLAALPRREVRGVDPGTGRESTWEGPDLAPLLTERVELARGGDTVIVRTADGKAVPIPLTIVRQLRPVLADRRDGEPLPQPVVAWPDAEQRGIRTDPRAPLWWAHEVVALEIASGQATYGRALAVPPGAPSGARRGAEVFATRCVACHELRSAGGKKGPDLTRVADRIDRLGLERMLAGHPGWAERGREPPGELATSHLWDYLRAIAADEAHAPPEETAPGDRRDGEPAVEDGGDGDDAAPR